MSVRDRYEVWEEPINSREFIVRDTAAHRIIWSGRRAQKECVKVCDLLNEAFEAGRRESLKVTG